MQISNNIDITDFNGKFSLKRRLKIKKQYAYLRNILKELPQEDSYRAILLSTKQQPQKNDRLLSSFFEGIIKVFS